MAHLDLMRAFGMALRRAKISVKYSEGYNPHMLVFFSSPLAVGLESRAEYVCVDTNEKAEIVIKKLSSTLPSGIQVLSAKEVRSNPNYAAALAAARYEIEFEKELNLKQILDKILSGKNFNMNFEKLVKDRGREKIEIVSKDVRNRILDLSGNGNKYKFLLLCGNLNLKADKLVELLISQAGESEIGYKIVKTDAFSLKDKKIKLEEIYLLKNPLETLTNFDDLA